MKNGSAVKPDAIIYKESGSPFSVHPQTDVPRDKIKIFQARVSLLVALVSGKEAKGARNDSCNETREIIVCFTIYLDRGWNGTPSGTLSRIRSVLCATFTRARNHFSPEISPSEQKGKETRAAKGKRYHRRQTSISVFSGAKCNQTHRAPRQTKIHTLHSAKCRLILFYSSEICGRIRRRY